MRVGIIALLQETNTFIAEATTLRHFEENLLVTGEPVRAAFADAAHEVGGMFGGLAQAGIDAVPIFAARALPFGVGTAETYGALKSRLLQSLADAGPLDGLLLGPHGATVSAAVPDVDGDWMTAVREFVGPKLPIISTTDPHANLTPAMVAAVNAMTAYRTNPHIDQRARGLEAASLMTRTLRGEIRPVTAAAFPPLVMNIDRQCTEEEPCAAMCRRVEAVRQRAGILSASLYLGFPYADVPEMGSAVLVVADGDRQRAEANAIELGTELWNRRSEFVAHLISPADGIEQARQLRGPVCLLDMGDNVGGGSAADGTILIHELHHRKLGPALACLSDPAAVRQADAAGEGATLTMCVGGKTDTLHGPPLEASFTVLKLADGTFEEPEARHGGIRHYDQGRTAIIRTETGLTLMLTTRRMVPFSLHQLTDFGIDPKAFQYVIAKGVNAPLAAYRPVCPSILRINTPGSTTADIESLTYHQRRRPLYPFERDTTWTPRAGKL
jgi:microcystin degradation protein MlrC